MRVAASVAVTLLATTVLAGCQFITPQGTTRSYTPSDGVNGSVGTIDIRNVFLVDGVGNTASLIGVLANNSSSSSSVTLGWTGAAGPETTSVQVPARGLLSLSTTPSTPNTSVPDAATSVVLKNVRAIPGALFPVTFTAAAQDTELRLPVLTGSFSQYSTLVPTPTPPPTRIRRSPPPQVPGSPAPTPAPTLTLTPTPTATLGG